MPTKTAASPAPARPAPAALALSVSDAAAISSLSRATLYRHKNAGRLRMLRVGGRTVVDAASLRKLLGVEA